MLRVASAGAPTTAPGARPIANGSGRGGDTGWHATPNSAPRCLPTVALGRRRIGNGSTRKIDDDMPLIPTITQGSAPGTTRLGAQPSCAENSGYRLRTTIGWSRASGASAPSAGRRPSARSRSITRMPMACCGASSATDATSASETSSTIPTSCAAPPTTANSSSSIMTRSCAASPLRCKRLPG
jgi:hypothetical protein